LHFPIEIQHNLNYVIPFYSIQHTTLSSQQLFMPNSYTKCIILVNERHASSLVVI